MYHFIMIEESVLIDNMPSFDEQTNLRIQNLMSTILAVRFSDLDKEYDTCVELLHISEQENYVKAFNCFNELDTSTSDVPHYAQMTANIISVCCRMKQIEGANYYFSLLGKSNQRTENQNQLYLCELLISAAVGDIDAIHKSVDKYIIEMQDKPKDIHQFFEILMVISESMIDVDYFKQYNDTYGHPVGDDALRAIADSLTDTSDSNIYNFRYGGDEFISLCKNKTAEEVKHYIHALSMHLKQKHIPHKASLCSQQLTLSIGYSF